MIKLCDQSIVKSPSHTRDKWVRHVLSIRRTQMSERAWPGKFYRACEGCSIAGK